MKFKEVKLIEAGSIMQGLAAAGQALASGQGLKAAIGQGVGAGIQNKAEQSLNARGMQTPAQIAAAKAEAEAAKANPQAAQQQQQQKGQQPQQQAAVKPEKMTPQQAAATWATALQSLNNNQTRAKIMPLLVKQLGAIK